MQTLNNRASSALEQISRAVAAHQIPNLSVLKSLCSSRERELKAQQNQLQTKIQDAIRRGEIAARRLYQRHTGQRFTLDVPEALQSKSLTLNTEE